MGSFQAAIQIIKPLDDNAWEVLKPRLLSQREEAQQRENELVAQTRIVQEKYDERRQQDANIKEVKDVNDREWDDIQAPLRARIGGYADEIIRDGWQGGAKVTKDNAPRFAAEVLIYVRKRFYAEVAKDEAAARAAGHEPKPDPPNGPFTQKLVLENMKWIFDIKIKPLTEQYSKELFLCNGCENNFKFYGFEGVIQHYAAKHTSTLSVGSIVVHWRAEWPEESPFNPDPSANTDTFPPTTKPISLYPNGSAASPHIHGYGGYPPVSGQAVAPVQVLQHAAGYQQNPVLYYGTPQYGEYSMPQGGPFAAPPAIQGQHTAFQGPPYQNTQPSGYQPYQGQGYPVQNFDGPYPNGAPMSFESPHPSQVYPAAVAEQPNQAYHQAAPFQLAGAHNAGQYSAGQYNSAPRPVVPVRTEEYKAQLYDVAQSAREVWNHTAGVKDMPGSVRVYVILYHILKRYRAKYPDDPPLAMLIDGLSNNKDMRPVRNVNGLACRACKLEKAAGSKDQYKGSSKGSGGTEKKLFSLPQLLNHFNSTHIEGSVIDPPIFDWTQDMVELPENARISAIARAQGMDDLKMKLISEALPDAFRISPPRAEPSKPEPTYPRQAYNEDELAYTQLAPSRDDHQKYYSLEPQGRYPADDREHYHHPEVISRELFRDNTVIVAPSSRSNFEDRAPPPVAFAERREGAPCASAQAVDEYGRHVIREDEQVYSEPGHRYRNPDSIYQDRRGRAPDAIPYKQNAVPRIEHGYVREVSLPRLLEMTTDRLAAKNAGNPSHHSVIHPNGEQRPHYSPKPVPYASVPPRNMQSSRADPVDGGSEDGELSGQATARPLSRNIPHSAEGDNAAERFLKEFQPGQTVEKYARNAENAERRNEDAVRGRWDAERIEGMQRMHQVPIEQHRAYDRFDEGGRSAVLLPEGNDRSPEPMSSRPRRERLPQQRAAAAYDYDDRYVEAAIETSLPRPRSSELNDHHLRMDAAIYRSDRQAIQAPVSGPSRLARYESVRPENDRGRSRSPVYVKVGAVPGHYREQSPLPRYAPQEPIYRTRTPQTSVQEIPYERAPRQEYYRVYTDEPPSRQPVREEQFEYVQVADPEGDYLIRRPIRREVQPVYTTYDDGFYATRPPAHENRATVSRSDPAYYEEYDPRHPAPPPSATVRQVRYQ